LRNSRAAAPVPGPFMGNDTRPGATKGLRSTTVRTGVCDRRVSTSRVPPYLSVRYLDTFARHDGLWRFAERKLVVDWTDKRPSSPQ
jgi:hypothetical protein